MFFRLHINETVMNVPATAVMNQVVTTLVVIETPNPLRRSDQRREHRQRQVAACSILNNVRVVGYGVVPFAVHRHATVPWTSACH